MDCDFCLYYQGKREPATIISHVGYLMCNVHGDISEHAQAIREKAGHPRLMSINDEQAKPYIAARVARELNK